MTLVDIADRIVVIEDGKIAQSGAHDELMAKDGVYKKLVTMADS
jgi:ABC-type multidrug transport system fused ATPase/permease subunit